MILLLLRERIITRSDAVDVCDADFFGQIPRLHYRVFKLIAPTELEMFNSRILNVVLLVLAVIGARGVNLLAGMQV